MLAWRRPVDVDAMNDGRRRRCSGEHDFAAFCRPREGATTVRTLLELEPAARPTALVEAEVVADAFCHPMVRALVGALLAVGEGRRPSTGRPRVLAARRARPPACRCCRRTG